MSDQPETPAEAGQNVQSPEQIADSTDNMSKNELPEESGNRIAEVIREFGQLTMERTGGCRYTVLSWSDNTLSAYRVNTVERTCTCEDYRHRHADADDGSICKHIAYALYQAPEDRELDREMLVNLVGAVSEMQAYKDVLEHRTKEMEMGLPPSDVDTSASADTDESTEESGSSADHDLSPEDAAERLQSAFDDVVEDMQVTANNGYVWIQTGKDTPETLPGPGNVEVFEAFLQNAEHVQYVHDDHELANQKPGEWWQNAIDPSDVDDYIAEVLQ